MKTPSPTNTGTDLLDGVIYGAAYLPSEDEHATRTAARFARTPVYTEVGRGMHAHIGSGIFLHRCPECDSYVRSYAGIVYVPAYEQHLLHEHGIDRGPMLPKPRP